MSVLLCGDLPAAAAAEWLQQLRAAAPDETWLTERSPAIDPTIDVAVVANPPAGALQGLPALRLVQSLWAGVEGLVGDASLPAEVPLARMVDPLMNQAMAETALWAVLALQRDFYVYARQQRQAVWQVHPQRRAADWPVLVLGLGEMGRTVAARLAGSAYPVSGWSRSQSSLDGIDCLSGEAGLIAALGRAEVVVNLLPLTAATRGFFDAERLAAMRRGAHLVNLARGAHLVEADVIAALDSGQLGELVVDAFATEPLPPSHGFWRHPRVTVLPHIAAQTDKRSAAGVVAANLARLRSGQPPLHLVDRQRGY
ncbi:2-hydroxyacid dehydrogenase [Piscinibacter sakaiensis]|uniref:2-hydroxyacid dehydrogenase n=1 Tax=Piscinibacter sakaiensis TaxID=1547922 RepID=UPI003AAC9EC1